MKTFVGGFLGAFSGLVLSEGAGGLLMQFINRPRTAEDGIGNAYAVIVPLGVIVGAILGAVTARKLLETKPRKKR